MSWREQRMLGVLTVEGQNTHTHGNALNNDIKAHASGPSALTFPGMHACVLRSACLCSDQSMGSQELGHVRQDEPAGQSNSDHRGWAGRWCCIAAADSSSSSSAHRAHLWAAVSGSFASVSVGVSQVSIAVNRDKQHTRTIDGGGVACEFNQTLTFNLDCQPSDVVHIKINHDGVIDKCVGVFSVTLDKFINKVQCKRVRIQIVDEDTLTHPTGFIELVPDYHGTNDPMPDAVRKAPGLQQEQPKGSVAPASVAAHAAAPSYPSVAAPAPAPAAYSAAPQQPHYQPPQQYQQHQPQMYSSPQYQNPPLMQQQYNSSPAQVQQPVWQPPQFQQSAPVYGQPPVYQQQQMGGWQPQMYGSPQQPQMQMQQQHPPQQPPQRAGPPVAYPVREGQPH